MKTNKEVNTVEEVATVEARMPIDKIAEDLKKAHGLKQVYVTNVADQFIIWRKLKRSEYKEVMLQEFNENEDLAFYERQDYIASKVILYPENVEELLEDFAGIADIIATETMVKTGFGLTNTKVV